MDDYMARQKANEINGAVESHMLLQKVADAVTQVQEATKKEIPVISGESAVVFTPSGQKLKETFEDPVNKVFEHGLTRIGEVRYAADLAEQTLKRRREAVIRSVADLVYTIQELEKHTGEMQSSLGELIVATDNVGTGG